MILKVLTYSQDGAAAAFMEQRGSNGDAYYHQKGDRDGRIHTSYMGTVAANVAIHDLKMLTAGNIGHCVFRVVMALTSEENDDWLDAVTRTGWTAPAYIIP